jgi:DNA-binding LacI/PurR family transcriptional regulator
MMMGSDTVQTIADIARLAGVSKSTVSRALNDSPLIGDETKERIRAIAEEHRFQINLPARRLSLKQSNTIAFVTYAYKQASTVPDMFMLELQSGIATGLHESGYDMLIVQVDPDDTNWASAYLETGRADGFIVLQATCTQSHIETLLALNAPFAIWGVHGQGKGYCSVAGDDVAGGRIAVGHLLDTGRSRIAFLGGPAKAFEVRDRVRGYEEALADAGIEVDPSLVAHGDYTAASGAATMRALLEQAPDIDAVFVTSDTMAIAAMDAIREHGRSVPADVAVVGYDDISTAQLCNPPLTTIRQSGPLAGRLLAQNLVQYMRTGVVTSVSIPAELVIREST